MKKIAPEDENEPVAKKSMEAVEKGSGFLSELSDKTRKIRQTISLNKSDK